MEKKIIAKKDWIGNLPPSRNVITGEEFGAVSVCIKKGNDITQLGVPLRIYPNLITAGVIDDPKVKSKNTTQIKEKDNDAISEED